MSAPALLLLAPAAVDRATLTALVREVHRGGRGLTVTGTDLTGLDRTLADLAGAGHAEVVVVPLDLSAAPDAVLEPRLRLAGADGLRVRVTAPLGHEPGLLAALDDRLRETLRLHRVRELDALVLAGAGSPDALANASVARLARQWGTRHHLPVTAAYAVSAPPATAEAVRAFRREGRRHIAVGSLFLTSGPLAERAGELALEAGALAVSRPLGAHPEVARVVLARYAVGAVELVPV